MATITENTLEQREQAIESSEGSLNMEGLALDAITREINRKYASGEFTLEQFSNAIDAHVASIRLTRLQRTA